MNYKLVISGLRKLRALLSKGWCRGESHKSICGRDHFCISGGMDNLLYHKKIASTTHKLMFDELGKEFYVSYPYAEVIDFNDTAKDKRYVLRLIDRTIRRIENEHKKTA